MKKCFKLLSFSLVIVLLVASLAGCAKNDQGTQGNEPTTEPAKKITWKLGHLSNEEHIWHKTALKFAELVNEKSNGQIEIKVYPNEQLGKEVDVINMIQTGAADMTITGESMQTWAPKAALMAVPYAFNSGEQLKAAVEGEIGDEIEAQVVEKVGLKPIYYHIRAPRNLTSNVPVRTPEDAKGLKIRVPNVPIYVEAWKAAGANPQVMAFSEVFTALQQHVIDAQENPYDLIYSGGLYEVQKYVNETEHVYGWIYVTLGQKQYDALSDELKKAVEEAAKEAQVYGDQLFQQEIANYKQQVQDKGMEIISDVDKEAFRNAMEPAVLKSLNEEQKALYEKILNSQK
jgi:tripartite ATP-independent transporter DctP family solute receptor